MAYECLNPILAHMKFNSITQKNEMYGFLNLRKMFIEYGDNFKEMLHDDNVVLLPCRKCINCQMKRSLMWSIRSQHEALQYDEEQCLFVTITYDNEHVVDNRLFANVGFDNNIFSLKKSDLQKFIKDLRNCFKGFKIRYFACGEYGGITLRPHYHILLYGLSINNIAHARYKGKSYVIEKKYETKNGYVYYSELLENAIWKKGFVEVSLFSPATANYVARYCTKKQKNFKREKYNIDVNNLQPIFNLMSLKPPIGFSFFNLYKDKIYKDDSFLFHFNGKSIVLKPFAFYDKHYDIERPEEYAFVKENRKEFAKLNNYFDKLETNLNISEYLRNMENSILEKLKRKEVI